jgi:hypothetical protein
LLCVILIQCHHCAIACLWDIHNQHFHRRSLDWLSNICIKRSSFIDSTVNKDFDVCTWWKYFFCCYLEYERNILYIFFLTWINLTNSRIFSSDTLDLIYRFSRKRTLEKKSCTYTNVVFVVVADIFLISGFDLSSLYDFCSLRFISVFYRKKYEK